MRNVFFGLALVFGGCERSEKCGTYEIDKHWTLLIWVEHGEDLDPSTVVSGCNFWNTIGVTCVLVFSEEDADVKVFVNSTKDCEDGKDGGVIIGRAYLGGAIEIFTGCMSKDDETLRNICAHEVGHQLGVRHTNQADNSVMSPTIETSHQCLLQADIVAWVVRNKKRSVLESSFFRFSTPSCSLEN